MRRYFGTDDLGMVPPAALAAGIIIRLRPEPFWALAYGTGLGSAGVLIISACLAWVKRGSDLFQPPGKPKA